MASSGRNHPVTGLSLGWGATSLILLLLEVACTPVADEAAPTDAAAQRWEPLVVIDRNGLGGRCRRQPADDDEAGFEDWQVRARGTCG